MQKIFYPFDAQAFWMRVGFASLLIGMAILVGIMVLLFNLDLPRKLVGVLTIPPMFLLLVWELALPLFVRQRVEDGLRIDENGLIRALSGREDSWRWDEISEFRLHSGWHPMSLLIGRSITFRGRRPAGRSRLAGLVNRIVFRGRNIALGDNYLVVSEELADRLNRYRDMATGTAPKPAAGETERTLEPALYTARDSLDPGKRSKAILIMLGTTLAFSIVAVGFVMWSDDWLPGSVEEFVNSERVAAMLVPGFVLLAQSLGQHFWQISPASNLILVAAGGLHCRKGLVRRLWRWDEIADIAVKDAPPVPDDKSSSKTVSFASDHDGTKPGKPAPDGDAHALFIAIDDIYDAPPSEIARQLKFWVQWGQAHTGPATHGAVAETAAAARPITSAMRFRRQVVRPSGALRTPVMLAFWTLLLGSLAATLLIHMLARNDTFGPALLLAVSGASLLMLFGGIGMLSLVVSARMNHLEVDPSGLVYRRLGWRKTYGWHELGGFELRSAALRWGWKKRTVILFAAPRDDRISRFMRWAYRIDGALPRIVIEDVYDIAASELLATFQQYIRRPGKPTQRRPAA